MSTRDRPRPDLFGECEDVESCESHCDFVPRSIDPDGGLNRVMLGRFVALVRRGHRKSVVADTLMIPRSTLAAWLRRGRVQISKYDAGRLDKIGLEGEFVLATQQAQSEWHVATTEELLDCEDPAIRFRILRARFPEHYEPNSGRSSIDDDTAEVIEHVDPAMALLERLASLDRARAPLELEAGEDDEPTG